MRLGVGKPTTAARQRRRPYRADGWRAEVPEMANRPAATTQATIARALRAVKAAGVQSEVKIAPDGTITIIPIDPDEKRAGAQAPPKPDPEPVIVM